jgi:hypothetical protein
VKRSGRPPLDQAGPTAQVTVYMPAKRFDDLCRQARQEQVSVPEIIRRKRLGQSLDSDSQREGVRAWLHRHRRSTGPTPS